MIQYEMHRPDDAARLKSLHRWDAVAKPLHSLGAFEPMVAQLAAIQETPDVRMDHRCVLVFCADNGVVSEGVSQSGQEVTALVAHAIAEGTSNVNLMAASARADVFCVDVGMAHQVEHPAIFQRRIAAGTTNMACGPAMTRTQAEKAIQTGVDLVGEMKQRGYQAVAIGEMGIGNTTTTAAVACALLGLSPEMVTGRGAGLSDAGLSHKAAVIRQALAINQPDAKDPVDVLAKVGGFDLAAMCGACLGAMTHGVAVVLDGVISACAALCAVRMCPEACAFLVPSHMSREPAARAIFAALNMTPVLHADLALGEGTGAVLLFPMLDAALAVYHGTHTFGSLGMEAYTEQEGQA